MNQPAPPPEGESLPLRRGRSEAHVECSRLTTDLGQLRRMLGLINNEWYLVDLPGYGFAKRSKKEVQRLEQMINGYILQREQLVNVFLLVDVRLEAQQVDLDFIQWLGASSVPFAIVFTKADKLSVGKVSQNVEAYKKVLSETWEELPPIFVTSSEKKQGREEILDYIDSINKTLI